MDGTTWADLLFGVATLLAAGLVKELLILLAALAQYLAGRLALDLANRQSAARPPDGSTTATNSAALQGTNPATPMHPRVIGGFGAMAATANLPGKLT